MRALGFLSILLGLLATVGEAMHIAFPTARWFFETSRQVPWLHTTAANGTIIPWFGWLCVAILVICGFLIVVRSFSRKARNPLTKQRIQRFRYPLSPE